MGEEQKSQDDAVLRRAKVFLGLDNSYQKGSIQVKNLAGNSLVYMTENDFKASDSYCEKSKAAWALINKGGFFLVEQISSCFSKELNDIASHDIEDKFIEELSLRFNGRLLWRASFNEKDKVRDNKNRRTLFLQLNDELSGRKPWNQTFGEIVTYRSSFQEMMQNIVYPSKSYQIRVWGKEAGEKTAQTDVSR